MVTAREYNQVFKPGAVYRREYLNDLARGDIDYLLRKLCREGVLKKVQNGLYYCPVLTEFGEKFPKENQLLKTFLKSKRFLCVSPNDYNSLGLGTTQMYNIMFVYNTKRNGIYKFLGRKYRFFKKFDFPPKVTREFLVVDLLNNLKSLAEDEIQIKENLRNDICRFDVKNLAKMAELYGKVGTRKFIKGLVNVPA